ncbi:MAG: DUF4332 domain-containing protein [Nanobdellota archaeon]
MVDKRRTGRVSPKRSSSPFREVYPVESLEGIGPEYKKKLVAIGIENTEQLWNADATMVAEKTGAPLVLVNSWQNMAELTCVKDIGPQYSELIERSGIHTIEQLKACKPNELLKLVTEKQDALNINIQGNTPGHDLVKNWIDQARKIEA